jgi:flagellin-specific chaperone FliS
MYGTQRAQAYKMQEVMGASPLRLVVMAYDVAIRACEAKDLARGTQAVSLLRDSLNFDYAEASLGLFRLYQWSLDCMRQGEWDEALKVLRELREAWTTVEKQLAAGSTVKMPVLPSLPAGVASALSFAR